MAAKTTFFEINYERIEQLNLQANPMDDRRAHRRQLMHGVALIGSVTLDEWQPIILLDLSSKGVSFSYPVLLLKGERRTLRFRLPENDFLHQVQIEVVHSATWGVPSGYRVGALLVALEPRSATAIDDFLAKPIV